MYASESMSRVLARPQIHGNGYIWESEVNRLFRATKLLEIGAAQPKCASSSSAASCWAASLGAASRQIPIVHRGMVAPAGARDARSTVMSDFSPLDE
jgi:hypothetical protein